MLNIFFLIKNDFIVLYNVTSGKFQKIHCFSDLNVNACTGALFDIRLVCTVFTHILSEIKTRLDILHRLEKFALASR